eukprot:scaffold216787_cov13-Tisochrysis_lutea.AAC.1
MQGRARPDDDSAGPTPSQDTPSDQQSRVNGWPIGEGAEHAGWHPAVPAAKGYATTTATTTTTSRFAAHSTQLSWGAASTRQPPQLISDCGSPTQEPLDPRTQDN